MEVNSHRHCPWRLYHCQCQCGHQWSCHQNHLCPSLIGIISVTSVQMVISQIDFIINPRKGAWGGTNQRLNLHGTTKETDRINKYMLGPKDWDHYENISVAFFSHLKWLYPLLSHSFLSNIHYPICNRDKKPMNAEERLNKITHTNLFFFLHLILLFIYHFFKYIFNHLFIIYFFYLFEKPSNFVEYKIQGEK